MKSTNDDPKNKSNTPSEEVNPLLPAFLVKAPWYAASTEIGVSHTITTKHQQFSRPVQDANLYHQRLVSESKSKRFRKGACENCGALTHQRSECVERPRAKGARWTGKDICPDDFVQTAALDYDGKRDRWGAYNPEEYLELIRNWESDCESEGSSDNSSNSEGSYESDVSSNVDGKDNFIDTEIKPISTNSLSGRKNSSNLEPKKDFHISPHQHIPHHSKALEISDDELSECKPTEKTDPNLNRSSEGKTCLDTRSSSDDKVFANSNHKSEYETISNSNYKSENKSYTNPKSRSIDLMACDIQSKLEHQSCSNMNRSSSDTIDTNESRISDFPTKLMSNNHNASISECSITNDLNINFNNADSLITKPDIKVNNETSKHFTSYPSRQADRQDLKQSSKSQINKSPVITGMFRVREDTAKYLKDLDSSSVQDYDPKRRALKLPISQGGDLIPENEASDLIPVWDQHLKPSDTKIIKETPILKMDFVDKPDPALEMYGPILTANPDDFIEASDTFIDYGATATTRKFVPSRKS